ncbi:hypothetical protein, partial [Salmonella sp. SAL4443]|uniref:hypothetical protein n=1 Tax=Salmonella sp. SAL4443 TaxID=3159898 RepID=UPI00397C28AD
MGEAEQDNLPAEIIVPAGIFNELLKVHDLLAEASQPLVCPAKQLLESKSELIPNHGDALKA